MLSLNNNEMAVPCWDRLPSPLIGNFTRGVVAGQMRGAPCATLACVPPERKLSIESNLTTADDGGAHRTPEVASRKTRSRRRRRHAPNGYISIRQLAEQADAALSSAYSWVETGKLPASRWRGIIVVAERDVAEFLSLKPLRSVVADTAAGEANHD